VAVIRAAFERAAARAATGSARRDRRVEDILAGDTPTFMELPLALGPDDLRGADAAVIGFGYEGITIKTPLLAAPATASRPPRGSAYWRMGADKAPAAIRLYSLYYSIHHNQGWYPEIDPTLTIFDEIGAVDYGDVAVEPADTALTMRRASDKVADIVAAGALPIVFGGDHTIPFPTLRGIRERSDARIGIISFDAHMDLSDTPEYWASTEWVKSFELGGIRPENFVEIGIRSNRSTYFERLVAEELGIRVFNVDEVKRVGMQAVIEEAVARACQDTDALYVSVDIDVMEPGLVPAQKAPEFWGLTVDEMMVAMRHVCAQRLAGIDICEHTPDYDVNGMGAQFCARLAVEALAGLAQRKRAAGAAGRSGTAS
jgi:agmatinase